MGKKNKEKPEPAKAKIAELRVILTECRENIGKLREMLQREAVREQQLIGAIGVLAEMTGEPPSEPPQKEGEQ